MTDGEDRVSLATSLRQTWRLKELIGSSELCEPLCNALVLLLNFLVEAHFPPCQ